MKLYEFFGYDRHGEISELDTALNKGKLNTKDVSFSALGFNAPAWVAASSMSILYSISGHQAPLAILIAFFFPMLVLAVCMVALTRRAPSAGGIFTFCSRFLHPDIGCILGWTYAVACIAVTPMCALIGSEYIQALIPSLAGELNAKIIGTLLIVTFFAVSVRGVGVTAKLASTFLVSLAGIALLWWKPLDKIVWYYDVVTITLVMSYISALAAFMVMTWKQHKALTATLLSIPALLALFVLAYIGYTAGANESGCEKPDGRRL